ncbi:MAG TPA: DNRLRE domain-containing protein [Deltaproteobacteria bacterium]|nr:DNRLRE domain-containing protein [Deltaproteobacteria bacterium]
MKKSIIILLFLALAISIQTTAKASYYILTPIDDIRGSADNGGFTINDHRLHTVNFAYHVLSYLKFDLSDVDDSGICSAKLYLYEIDSGYTNRAETIELYAGSHDNWNEQTPFPQLPTTSGGYITRASYPANWYDWMTWDLSSYDFTQDLQDNYLTLILEINSGGLWNMTAWASSEYPDQSLSPYLQISTNAVPLPPSVILLLSGMGAIFVSKKKASR